MRRYCFFLRYERALRLITRLGLSYRTGEVGFGLNDAAIAAATIAPDSIPIRALNIGLLHFWRSADAIPKRALVCALACEGLHE